MLDYFNTKSPQFSAVLELEEDTTDDNFLLHVAYTLKRQETLQRLIDSEEATFGLHLECTSTMYRRLLTTQSRTATFEVPMKFLNNTITVNYFIIANKDINNYTNVDVDQDSEGFMFAIEKGDLLALGPPENVSIEKDPIIEVDSIFELIPTPKSKARPIEIDLSGSKIRIHLPKENFEELALLRKYSSLIDSILISMYYSPAITEALRDIKSRQDFGSIEEIHDSAWYKSIEKQLASKKVDLTKVDEEDLLFVSHVLLDDPNKKAIDALNELLDFGGVEN